MAWEDEHKVYMAEKHHCFYSISLTTLRLMLLFFSTTRIEFKVSDHNWWRPLGRFSLSFIGKECLPEEKKSVSICKYPHEGERACVFGMRKAAAGCVSKLSKSDFLWPAGLLKHKLFWRTQKSNWYQLRRHILNWKPN